MNLKTTTMSERKDEFNNNTFYNRINIFTIYYKSKNRINDNIYIIWILSDNYIKNNGCNEYQRGGRMKMNKVELKLIMGMLFIIIFLIIIISALQIFRSVMEEQQCRSEMEEQQCKQLISEGYNIFINNILLAIVIVLCFKVIAKHDALNVKEKIE